MLCAEPGGHYLFGAGDFSDRASARPAGRWWFRKKWQCGTPVGPI